eukprot:gene13368-9196_t
MRRHTILFCPSLSTFRAIFAGYSLRIKRPHTTGVKVHYAVCPDATALGGMPWRRFSATALQRQQNDRSDAAAQPQLPGVNLGLRVACPSQQFPATLSDHEPVPPSDPRVLWKEHFCSEKQQPYYHNIATDEVTFQVPNGFVTRFPLFYKRNGFEVDASGAVRRDDSQTNTASESPQGTPASHLSHKQKLAAYGAGGILWYLIVHNLSLISVFSCIYFFNIDLLSIARSYGFHVPLSDRAGPIGGRPSFLKSLLLAIVLNKLLVPVQLLVALASAPRVIHYVQPIAVRMIPKVRQWGGQTYNVVNLLYTIGQLSHHNEQNAR